jgi:hypothetical protein
VPKPLAAAYMSGTRGEKHPRIDEMRSLAADMLAACAAAKGIDPNSVAQWIEQERLIDPNYFLPALNAVLEKIVGEDGWLFDRSLVG